MTSHALSKRRSYKPRPDVCATHVNPGRCEPPPPPPSPPVTCDIGREDFNMTEGEEELQHLDACAPHLPVDEAVAVEWDSPLLSIEVLDGPSNCTEEDEEYIATADKGFGDSYITATFTFSDATTCISTLQVHVDEEEDD